MPKRSWYLCSICRARLMSQLVRTDAGEVEVVGCERCDRVKCRECGQAIGELFTPSGGFTDEHPVCSACSPTSPST